jgi:hypothetical protein
MRFADLLIVQPSPVRFIPAPPADAPHVVEALEWARQGSRPDACPAPGADLDKARAQSLIYSYARAPERLTAPASWPVELALPAASIVLAPLRPSLPFPPVESPVDVLRGHAERASARRRGVTPATVPHWRIDRSLWLLLAAELAWGAARREPRRERWTIAAATGAVRRIGFRRSWERAYAAALRASQD